MENATCSQHDLFRTIQLTSPPC